MEKLGKFVLWLVGTIVGTLVGGLVISKIWGWFIVTTFGYPELRVVEAIGIAILISFFNLKIPDSKEDDKTTEDYVIKWVTGVVLSFVILLIAYIWSLFL